MRTTVELTNEQRARLLQIAAERGEKGFSRLVQEAVDRYLEEESSRRDRVRAAIAVLGTLDDEAADRMAAHARDLRGEWR